jgi:hypothetical protein
MEWLKEFSIPFFLVSGLCLIFLHLIKAEALLIDDDVIAPWGVILLCASFLFWYFFEAKEKMKKSIQTIMQVVFPFTFATLLALEVADMEISKDFSQYLLIFFIAQCILYFLSKKLEERKGVAVSRTGNYFFHALVGFIMVAGIFLCVREAYSTPTLSVDESHSSIAASGILTRGFPYFPNTEVIYSRSWIDLYSIALSYKLFGINEFSARMPSIIAYVLAIFIMFLILRKNVSKTTTVVVLALFSLNPWVLHYGSYARMYIFLLLFSTLYTYLLISYIQTKKRIILYLLLPLTLVGGLFSERSFMLFAPPYGLLVLWSLPRTWEFWKKSLLYIGVPAFVLLIVAVFTVYSQVQAFIERYVIGFGGGGGLLEYARIVYTPLEWLAYYGLPTILLIVSTVIIILRGNVRDRIILALFWFGQFLVDILVYSNFPSRRFNYTFILVSLYTMVIAFGLTKLFQIIPKWQKQVLVGFIILFMGYNYMNTYSFPIYADFGKIQNIPEGSLVLGYPTSPAVFYDLKYNRGNDIRPFITDRIEMNKYVQDGKEIYSGGVPVMGVTPLNALRATEDVYLFYEKTRFAFLNERTETYILQNCLPIDETVALEVAKHIQNNYQFTAEDAKTRNTLIALKCPRLP